MTRRIFALLVGPLLFALCLPVNAQQQRKIAHIGLLAFSSATQSRNIDPFRDELHKLGYIDGKNILIDYRSAGSDRNRLRELADELVRTKVDVIVATGNQAIAVA